MHILPLTARSAVLGAKNFTLSGRKYILPVDCTQPVERFVLPHRMHFAPSDMAFPSRGLELILSIQLSVWNAENFMKSRRKGVRSQFSRLSSFLRSALCAMDLALCTLHYAYSHHSTTPPLHHSTTPSLHHSSPPSLLIHPNPYPRFNC